MTKTTYRRKSLLGFTVSKAIMEENMAVGRRGTRAIDENLYLIYNQEEAELSENGMGFWNSKVSPSGTSTPTRPHLLILSKPFHQLGIKNSNAWAYGGHFHSTPHSGVGTITFSVGLNLWFPTHTFAALSSISTTASSPCGPQPLCSKGSLVQTFYLDLKHSSMRVLLSVYTWHSLLGAVWSTVCQRLDSF